MERKTDRQIKEQKRRTPGEGWSEREREIFFCESPRAVGVVFMMSKLRWDLIVPVFVCVCEYVCVHLLRDPAGPSLFSQGTGLCEVAHSLIHFLDSRVNTPQALWY